LLVSLFTLAILPLTVIAFDVDSCLEDATDERTDALADAYSTYNDLMDSILSKFGDTESNAYRITDSETYRSGEISRAHSSYARQLEEANRNMSERVRQIWADYNAKVSLCRGGTYSSHYQATNTYVPNTAYNFVYPQSYSYTYPYTYSYSYRQVYPYQYYPYSYSYPYLQYAIYPYGQNSYYVSRPPIYTTDPYAYPYYRGRGSCRMPNIGNPPAGCAYKCSLDEDGCYDCRLRC